MAKHKAKKKAQPTKKKAKPTKKQVSVIPVDAFKPTDGILDPEKALREGDFQSLDTQLEFILKNIPSDDSDNFLKNLILFLAKISQFAYVDKNKEAQDYLYSFLQKKFSSDKELLLKLFNITLHLETNYLVFSSQVIELPLFGRHYLLIDILRVITENPSFVIRFDPKGFQAVCQLFMNQVLFTELIPIKQREQIVRGLLIGILNAKDLSETKKFEYVFILKFASGAAMVLDFNDPKLNILAYKKEISDQELAATRAFSRVSFNKKSNSSLKYTNVNEYLTSVFNHNDQAINYLLESKSFNKTLQVIMLQLLEDNKHYHIAFELTRIYEGCLPRDFGQFWYCISLYAKASQWRVSTGEKCWPTLNQLEQHDGRPIAFSSIYAYNIFEHLYQRFAINPLENSETYVWLEAHLKRQLFLENISLPLFYNLFLDELDLNKVMFSSILKIIHRQDPVGSEVFFRVCIDDQRIINDSSYLVPIIYSLTKANLGQQIQDYYKIILIRLLDEFCDTNNVECFLTKLNKIIEVISLSADKTLRFYYFDNPSSTASVYEANIQFFARYPEFIEALGLFIKAYEWRGESVEIKACQDRALACLRRLDDTLLQYKSTQKLNKPQPPIEKPQAERQVSANTARFFEKKYKKQEVNRRERVFHPSDLRVHAKRKNKVKQENNLSLSALKFIRAMDATRRKAEKNDTLSVQSEALGQKTMIHSSVATERPENRTEKVSQESFIDAAIIHKSGVIHHARIASEESGLKVSKDFALEEYWLEALMSAFYEQSSLTDCVKQIKHLNKEIKDLIFTQFQQALLKIEQDYASDNTAETPTHLKGLELYGTVYYQVDVLLKDINFYLHQPEFEVLIKELFDTDNVESNREGIQLLRYHCAERSPVYYLPYLRELEKQYPANQVLIHELIEDISKQLKEEITTYAYLLTEPDTSKEYKKWLFSTIAIMDEKQAHEAINAVREYIQTYNLTVDDNRKKVSLGLLPHSALNYRASASPIQSKVSSDSSHEVASTGLPMRK